MEVLIAVLSFVGGIWVGSYIQKFLFINQDWKVMRWNDGSLGFRTLAPGTKIYKNQRVLMALKLDTTNIEEEGMKIE
ncbi:MAG: hypothetical protein VXW71_02060 [Actinomycetota bacterium]|nr:hypothetical protein [Actinomycetota bacterium]